MGSRVGSTHGPFRPHALALGAILLLPIAGCGGTLDLQWQLPDGTVDSPVAEPVPQIPPPKPIGLGDGRDGALVVDDVTTQDGCVPLESTEAMRAVVADGSRFADGEVVLLHQTQDAFAISGDGAPIADVADAGAYELARVRRVEGNLLRFDRTLARGYSSDDDGRTAQACRVPQHGSVTITSGGTLRARPWDGRSGGIVALLATGEVRIEGEIDASAAGFRGGTPSANGGVPDIVIFDTTATNGGFKGEGLDGRSFVTAGRGNMANAGGGGNGLNAGGGGGSNGGAGGLGGRQIGTESNNPGTKGLGGVPILVPIAQRIVFGGGGGGGHQDDGIGARGGNGGGIVLIHAFSLAGNGRIVAKGEDAPDVSNGTRMDGGGGGGGGGSVGVFAATGAGFRGTVNVRGGDGSVLSAPSTIAFGPGGAGGGGRVRLPADASDSVSTNLAGGDPGFFTNGDAATLWGTTGGSAGIRE